MADKPTENGHRDKKGAEAEKTWRKRPDFKKPQREPNPTRALDVQKEKLHPGMALLVPDNVAALIVFQRQMNEQLALRFKYNGRLIQRGKYYSEQDALSTILEMSESIISLSKTKKKGPATPATTSAAPAAVTMTTTTTAARQDDDDDDSTSSDDEGKTRHKVSKFFKSISDEQREDLQRSQIQQALKLSNEAYLSAASERPQIYQFILSGLSEASLAVVNNHDEYRQLSRAADDPLSLWRIIEATHQGQQNGNTALTKVVLQDRYHEIKQSAGESIHFFYERFLATLRALESNRCKTPRKQDQAIHFLRRLDQSRYAQFMADLQNGISSGAIPDYPTTVEEAYNLAKNRVEARPVRLEHARFTGSAYIAQADRQRPKTPYVEKKTLRADKKTFTDRKKVPSSKGPKKCLFCDGSGHLQRECPEYLAAKKERGLKANRPSLVANTNAHVSFKGLDFSDGESDTDKDPYQAYAHTTLACANVISGYKLRRYDVLLDNQATASIFCCQDLLDDVHIGDAELRINGYVKGQAATTRMVGRLGPVFPVYITSQGSTNILALHQVEDGGNRVEYTPGKCFRVLFKGSTTWTSFDRKDNGLFVADGRKIIEATRQCVMVTTVQDMEQKFTKHEVKQARLARELQRKMAFPSDDVLMRTINNGGLINTDVTAKDVQVARTIYGPDEAFLHGRTRTKPQTGIPTINLLDSDVPRPQTLMIDLMVLQGTNYLVSVSKPLQLIMTTTLPTNKKAATLAAALLEQVFQYRAKGFPVIRVISDPEPVLMALQSTLMQHGIDYHAVGPKQHVAPAEAAIKMIKERVRAVLHSLPYQLPDFLFPHAVDFVVRAQNCSVGRDTLMRIAPREAFLGRKTDATRDFKVAFGQYCHIPTHTEPRNSMSRRTTAAIALGAKGNLTGSVLFFTLGTKTRVTRDQFVALPMPDDAIELMNQLNQQREFNNTSSPTASLAAIFLVAVAAANERRTVVSLDITGAYLNASMGTNQVFMTIDRYLSGILMNLDPHYQNFRNPNGTITVQLRKALYGCLESALLWYERLATALVTFGLSPNPYDKCIFNGYVLTGVQLTVVVYVDDLLITCTDAAEIERLITYLRREFDSLTVRTGTTHSYLGMLFDFRDNGSVHISMDSYVCDILKFYEVEGTSASPATKDLFSSSECDALDPEHAVQFHSAVAKLAYVAKRTRPDILTAISYLSTRVKSPDVQDQRKLVRVLRYLNGTPTCGITLSQTQLSPIAYVDASYGAHSDCRSHTGLYITMGNGPVLVKSTKQKLNSKSSTEAELIALSDSLNEILWMREFLSKQNPNVPIPPATIYEDNQSTIHLIKTKNNPKNSTKHVNIRFFFISDKVNRAEVTVEYHPTHEMIADFFTKPLQGSLFTSMRNKLLNFSPSPETLFSSLTPTGSDRRGVCDIDRNETVVTPKSRKKSSSEANSFHSQSFLFPTNRELPAPNFKKRPLANQFPATAKNHQEQQELMSSL